MFKEMKNRWWRAERHLYTLLQSNIVYSSQNPMKIFLARKQPHEDLMDSVALHLWSREKTESKTDNGFGF